MGKGLFRFWHESLRDPAGVQIRRSNEITITVRDGYRNVLSVPQPLVFRHKPLPADMPTIFLLTNNPAQMEPGYTLV